MYKIVVIKSLTSGKKHKVQVEVNADEAYEKELAILRAIDDVVYDIVKGRVTPFLYAVGKAFENSRNYDDFIDTLETKLKIKAKIAK